MLTGRYVYFPNHIDDLILSSGNIKNIQLGMATDWGHKGNCVRSWDMKMRKGRYIKLAIIPMALSSRYKTKIQ